MSDAGMNIVRMNFSHGDYDWHGNVVKATREAEVARPLALALDTKGPEIRTGLLRQGLSEITIRENNFITITVDDSKQKECDENCIYVDYKRLPEVIKEGNLIFIDDGLLSLKVKEINGSDIKCKVRNTAVIGSRKGVNLPDVTVDLPAMSEKDKRDLHWGVEQGIDMVFASFIRRKEDVIDIRTHLASAGGNDIKIIAKIENHEGVRNFDSILEEADGIMVARGDLGIEIPVEKVFIAQKMMIAKCNIVGKPIICATQMLETMTYNPRPTRAEVSDVANAIIDGADCVMLSGETAKGKYPLQAVQMMHRIACEAESSISYRVLHTEVVKLQPTPSPVSDALASSAVSASFQTLAAAIVLLTTSGDTARIVSKYKPACPIICVTRNRQAARQTHLYRGCYTIWYNVKREDDWQSDVDKRFQVAFDFGIGQGLMRPGDLVIGLQGWRQGSGSTNAIRFLVCP
jgi:pyruvate kinase